MDDKNKLKLQEIMKRQYPDVSHIKPPTESAASKMVKNLRAAGAKADKKAKKVDNKNPQ